MKMYPDDWRFRLASGAVVFACLSGAMVLAHVIGLHGPWLGVLIPLLVGMVIGKLLVRLLFRPSPAGPPDQSPRD
jgi:hypothetical protein